MHTIKISPKIGTMRQKYLIIVMIIPMLALFPGCSAFMKGDMRLARSDYRGAVELYTTYLAEHPDNVDAKSNLGFAYVKAGMLDDAVDEFQSLLKITPGDPFATLYLGVTYLMQKKLLPAIKVWESFEDKSRPEAEEAIGMELTLLRSVAYGAESSEEPSPAVVRQMKESAEKVEAAWHEAELRIAVASGGDRSGGDGNDGGGGGGGGGG